MFTSRHAGWVSIVLAGSVWAAPAVPPTLFLGDVEFPHEMHVVEVELDCVSCHHETKAARLSIPHESYFGDSWERCKACHGSQPERLRPQSCGSCHHDSPTDIADETLSSKVVVHRSCWSCHEVGTGAQASRACRDCHRGSGETP